MTETNRLIPKTQDDSSYDHVLKYTGVFGGVQGLKTLAGLLKNKLMSSILHSTGMGLSDIYSNIVENVNAGTNFGLSFSAVRSVSEMFETGDETALCEHICVIRTWSVWTALLAAIICILGAPLLSYTFFDNYTEHAPAIVFLSLSLIAMPIEAGECAVLKGMRCLKRVTIIESLSAVGSLLTTIPLYYFFGIDGVVYALVLTQLFVTAVHLCFSVKVVPYRVKLLSTKVFREGIDLLKVGFPYAIAAVATAFTTAIIFNFIEDHGQIACYKRGILLLAVVSSLAFTAMDVDYFPRLSSVNHDRKRMNALINQQLHVCSMVITPLLLGLLIVLPYIVPLLLASDFTPVIGLCTCAVFHTYFRGLAVPVEYVALAKGSTWVYLIVEIASALLSYAMIVLMYPLMGLTGIGVGLSLALCIEVIVVSILYSLLFGFQPT
ncbi:MAG: oligosaccharide flippase family protein, partial [Bacteroidaceae bacterium]|nr:oligosaccharide flippase family protein [Bacteroidaceae bacterium]